MSLRLCVFGFLLFFTTALSVMSADTVPPALIWTGDVFLNVNVPCSPGGGNSASDTATGFFISGGCVKASGESMIRAMRPFSVTSAGNFILSETVSSFVEGGACNPGGCFNPDFLSASFSGFSGPGGLTVSDSASTGPLNPSGLFSFLGLSDAESLIVFLGIGDYQLSSLYEESASALTTDFNFRFNVDLTPTPEPDGKFLLPILIAFATFLKQRRSGLITAKP